MSRKYLSCAETAKLVRQALKESFPGVKFSVKSHTYSMGASINVNWEDGPNVAQVDAVVGIFEASYFDGMIDYKGSKYHKLDGEEVRFGADSIHTNRRESDALIERAIRILKAKYPGNDFSAASVQAFRNGELWKVFPLGGEFSNNNALDVMIRRTFSKISDRIAPSPSKTLERVKFAGDDGYGAGTVGRNGEGGEQCYKAQEAARQRQAEAEKSEIYTAILEQVPHVGGVQ